MSAERITCEEMCCSFCSRTWHLWRHCRSQQRHRHHVRSLHQVSTKLTPYLSWALFTSIHIDIKFLRFTSMIDVYMNAITSRLKDESLLVRRQCLTLLTKLLQVCKKLPLFIVIIIFILPSMLWLQEDYIKWKGSLFFRFVHCLVDENEEMRKFGKLMF